METTSTRAARFQTRTILRRVCLICHLTHMSVATLSTHSPFSPRSFSALFYPPLLPFLPQTSEIHLFSALLAGMWPHLRRHLQRTWLNYFFSPTTNKFFSPLSLYNLTPAFPALSYTFAFRTQLRCRQLSVLRYPIQQKPCKAIEAVLHAIVVPLVFGHSCWPSSLLARAPFSRLTCFSYDLNQVIPCFQLPSDPLHRFLRQLQAYH